MESFLKVDRDVPARMRDGTVLYSDIYYPEESGSVPAILMRLPYDKNHGQDYVYAHPSWFAKHGYLVVIQDVRGRWASEGAFYPFRHEMNDGYDTVEWVAGLPSCNGKVGMYGFSYVGATQLLAAITKPPHLTCICPAMTGSQYYDGWMYNGGALALAFATSWAVELSIGEAHHRNEPDLEREVLAAFNSMRSWYDYLPLTEFPLLKRNNLEPYFFDWLAHPTYDDYWKQWSVDLRYQEITVPVLSTAGWYDVFRDGTLENFNGIRQLRKVEDRGRFDKIVIGPWYHVPWAHLIGEIDFGEEARNIISEVHLRWFDYWLKGIDNHIVDEPSVRYFVMGENTWRDDDNWPPTGVTYSNYYIHSNKGANSLNGDGTLNRHLPSDEPPDIYVYDPRYPVPSLGGHSCCFSNISPMGPLDQRPVELLNQVLVYSTEPLERDVLVAGPVTAHLWAASSAKDTDFTIKLLDVYPDGKAINLTEGILRARYRESLEQTSLMKPDQVYKFVIQAGNICNIFKAGHQIRVEISSSNFPHWDRNTNSGNLPFTDNFSNFFVATQAIFHDSQRPSHITLPIVTM